MLKRGVWLSGVLLSAALAFPADHYRVAGQAGDLYFGHISFIEAKSDGIGPTIQREGSVLTEPAILNTPIGPGDIIRTTDVRRCEIQFDTGTIVRMDTGTELKVETILAGSLSADTGLSNLVLSAGRIYIMFKEYDERETFQVLTSAAAVKLKHGSVVVIAASEDGPTDVRVRIGKASILYGAEAARARTRTVKKLGRLVILADGRFEEPAIIPPTRRSRAGTRESTRTSQALHEGLSPLPKPLRNLPLAVFNFAQRFGNANGEWLWDDLYGYVWRPYYNDLRYPWGEWGLEPLRLRPLDGVRGLDVLGPRGALGLGPVPSRPLAVGPEIGLGLASRLALRLRPGWLGTFSRATMPGAPGRSSIGTSRAACSTSPMHTALTDWMDGARACGLRHTRVEPAGRGDPP